MQAKGAATFNSSVQQIPGHPPVGDTWSDASLIKATHLAISGNTEGNDARDDRQDSKVSRRSGLEAIS
jgi:hypothetical protein